VVPSTAFSSSTIAFLLGATGGNLSLDLPLYLFSDYYFPSYIADFIGFFDIVYFNACGITFEPRKNTSTESVFTMAYADDPMWIDSRGLVDGSTGVALPTEAALSSISNACTIVSYRPCVIRAAVDTKTKFFVSGGETNAQFNYINMGGATIRQSVPGSFYISGSASSADISSGIPLGDLYMTLDAEFCGFNMLGIFGIDAMRKKNTKKAKLLKILSDRKIEMKNSSSEAILTECIENCHIDSDRLSKLVVIKENNRAAIISLIAKKTGTSVSIYVNYSNEQLLQSILNLNLLESAKFLTLD